MREIRDLMWELKTAGRFRLHAKFFSDLDL
jgi:hypothetical protein